MFQYMPSYGWSLCTVYLQVMLKGVGSVTVDNSGASSKTKELRCSQRVFPRTHEPSVTTARCVCAVAPGPTVRPTASPYRWSRRPLRWVSGCVGLSTIFLDRRSSTGKLPAMSEWRYLSSREVHFLSCTRPWHTLARASLLVSRGVSSRETVRISTLKR